MSGKKDNVPKIRFPGFSDAWERRRLGDHAEILTGGTPKTSMPEYWEPREIPWMSSGEVNKRRLDETDTMISEKGLRNSSARWVEKHSVLIALAGQGKTRGTVAINNIPLTTNQSIAAIVPNKTLYYEFIYQNLTKRYDELRMISSGDGTRGGLNKQIVSDVVVPYPRYDEQVKIGNFFRNLDHLITLHQRKLNNVKNLKAGLLQKMFPKDGEDFPEVRFPGFTDAWERRKLGEIYKTYSGQTPLRSDASNFENPTTPWIKTMDLKNAEIFNNEENISDKGAKILKILPVDTVVIAMYGGFNQIGRTGLLTYPATINQALTALVPNEKIHAYFLITELNHRVSDWKYFSASSRKDPNITKKDVEDFSLAFPSLPEQTAISNFFRTLDDAITLHQRKLEHLQQQKRSLLQQMFV